MKKLHNLLLGLFIIAMFYGCNEVHTNSGKNQLSKINPIGNYVSDGYAKKDSGYDWVAVTVTAKTDSLMHIAIRSRADRKKPTCTFDCDAWKVNDTIYESSYEGKNILFNFDSKSVTIAPGNPEDDGLLYYFCSGGATLAGTYEKLIEALDENQIDQTVFNKTLVLQNIGFDISTTGKGSIQHLAVQPFGLEIDNSKIEMDIDGQVTDAEIEDMNSDGFPEVLIYTVSAGSGSYGNVIGFSVNNGKSVSQIYFPDIMENVDASEGYMGHDEFAIVETSLARRFRTYNEGDANSNPTGNYRQIQYKLVDGEASRKFVIDKIVEFPSE